MSEGETQEGIIRKNESLAHAIEVGAARHESLSLLWTDGQQHAVEVYALTSRQFHAASRRAKVGSVEMQRIKALMDTLDPENKAGDAAKLQDELWDWLFEVAAEARTDPAHIVDRLAPGEEWAVALKALELSKGPKSAPSTSPTS